jgi:RimJ/RimL family protein N-acetyltransferase
MTSIAQHQEPPILNITGEKVALGPLRRDLLPLYQKWNNDFEAISLAGMPVRPQTWEAAEAWYEQAGRQANEAWFTIYECAELRPIGLSILLRINASNRTATFAIGIGEKDYRGRGCGTEATILTLGYGFSALDLHNITLHVYSCNDRAIRAYTRAGFHLIGRRRESVRLGGQVYDDIYMDCLATEFQSPVLHRVGEQHSQAGEQCLGTGECH